jgi:hypothetical protein
MRERVKMSNIAKAIVAVTSEVNSLAKGVKNQHGGYNYVPIDNYYAEVGKVAAKHGLTWVLKVVSFEHLPNLGKSGAINFTYNVDIFHSSGDEKLNFTSLNILHPIQGAQSAGSAMSYADKIFMRQLFKVETGEQDADATNPNDLNGKPEAPKAEAPKPALSKEDEATLVAWIDKTIKTFLPDAKSDDDLKKYWADNKNGSIKRVKDFSEEAYNGLLSAFTARRNELKGESA